MIGTTIGPYVIVSKLGEGGMGEVYRANDTNLKRTVAIKVLSASVEGDADRLARLQREAEVLASLSHPNIAMIHGLERSGGKTALVMEFIEGPTLADRVARLRASGASARQAGIPLHEALPIAKQIADALDAAHEQGIVHRDLKPANIKVKEDGTVKVLDFGLAKALNPTADSRHSTTDVTAAMTSPAMTQMGVILGTAAYMSPEQARGRRVDKRTDIWAFGCVLFEMLAGRPAFAADDLVATLSAVVKDQPDWSALPADTPASLRRLLQRLLEKDPKRRARDIGDVRLELDALDAPAPVAVSHSRRSSLTPWIVAAALGGVAAGALGMWAALGTTASTASPQVYRVSLRLPPDQRLVVGPNEPTRLAISPDGTRIVYVANDRLYLRALDSADASPLANTEGATAPFFSPDGQSIGFAQKGKVVRFSLSGNVGVPLADIAYMIGGRWSDDGGIVFADAARGLFRVESTGGTVEQLVSATEPGQVFGGPDVLPGGEWVLYGQSRRVSPVADFETIAFSRKTRERRVLLENGPAQHMGRYLFYHGGTGTFVVPFDPARAQVTGQAVAIRLGIGLVLADVSRNGTLVYTRIPADVRRVPVWMTRDGKATPLPIEPATYRFPRVSPDGRRLAVSRTDARGLTSDVWLYSIDGTSTTRLTFDGRSGPAVWTSDGRRLAVSVGGSGNSNAAGSQALQLFVQEADGTGRPKRLTDNRNNRYPFAWFAGNTRLLFLELAANALDIGVLDTTTGNARMLLSSAANETRPDASPDGQWLAYTSNESGRDEIYVRPLQDVESGKWQVSTAGGHSPVWMPGGRELAYRAPGKMMIVTVHAGSPFRFDAPRPLFDDTYVNDVGGRSYDVAPDGRFLMLEDDESSVDQIEVIVNWLEELRRLMQAR